MLNIVLISFACLALAGVAFEEVTHISKAKVTLFFGALSWLVLFVAYQNKVALLFSENINEIANLWLFLMAAMTFVAYINKKGLIETLIYLILPKQINEKSLLFLVGAFGFVFSSFADNITATLVSIALVQSLKLSFKDTLRFTTLVVFAVNSGGVSLITGDVTTLMIFLSGHVNITQLLFLILPSAIGVLVLSFMLSIGLSKQLTIEATPHKIRPLDLIVAIVFVCTIFATMAGNIFFSIPPVLSFLFGLSVMFLIAGLFKEDVTADPIMEYIRLIEFETLLFFLGVLLIVGMLKQIGVLENINYFYSELPPLVANYSAGLLSALIDNVPLTAALIKGEPAISSLDWLVLTYSVGVGGSVLIIGSSAGIIAMSKVPGLTFTSYLRYSIPVLMAYSVGVLSTYGLTLVL